MQFLLSGLLIEMGKELLNLDKFEITKLFNSYNIKLTDDEFTYLTERSQGNLLFIYLLCREMKNGKSLDESVFENTSQSMFRYLDEIFFLGFPNKLKEFLLKISLFDSFTVNSAKAITQSKDVLQTINSLYSIGSFLLTCDNGEYCIDPFSLRYLRRAAEITYSTYEIYNIYNLAAEFFEENDEIGKALYCYKKINNNKKIYELLIKDTQLHPGIAHYYEDEPYFRSLPDSEIKKSPVLICSMSMLCSICREIEQSEYWYNELKNI